MNKLKLRPILIGVLFIFSLSLLSACGSEETTEYTVRFVSNGGSPVSPIQVENGKRIPEVGTLERTGDYEFKGWYEDDETFEDRWDFETDIVTEDVTLYAHWTKIEPYPTEVGMTDDSFSSKMTWVQTGVDENTDFELTFYEGTAETRQEEKVIDGVTETVEVEYYTYEGDGQVIDGSHETTDETVVSWTPGSEIQGGVYKVAILTDDEEEVVIEDLPFKGEGTESNPYLIFESKDIKTIANGIQSSDGKHYRVAADFEHESAYTDIEGNVFSGQFDGDGREITMTGNAGLFYELSPDVIIDDFDLRGTLETGSTPLLGAIAHENHGVIRNTTSWTKITSTAGEVGNPETKLVGGAAGFVGINHEGGLIEDSRFRSAGSSVGVIKAQIGAAGVASINYGTISRVENRGAMGAFNAVESGRSLSRYSYMGGIAGFNYGVIEECNTTSVGKLLAQRFWNVEAPESGNNRVVGGIAGYNGEDAVIRESYFNGIRVHGDQYVGGIAGINAGLIEHSYAGARFYSMTGIRSYVGGRLNVGGIAGDLEGDGRIESSYGAINVYAYEDTPYAIAEEAYDSVYITINHDLRSSGDPEYGQVPTDDLAAPQGTGNTAVNNDPLETDDEVYYKLPGSYSDTLGEPFVESENQTILAWELE